jgi:muramoyltetrapeptide carboxypeptidase
MRRARSGDRFRIGVVAPGAPLDREVADEVRGLAAELYPDGGVEIVVHRQCFLSHGHFAGDDAARTAAFLDFANDPAFDAVWFARGGYGACRLVEGAFAGLAAAAEGKA